MHSAIQNFNILCIQNKSCNIPKQCPKNSRCMIPKVPARHLQSPEKIPERYSCTCVIYISRANDCLHLLTLTVSEPLQPLKFFENVQIDNADPRSTAPNLNTCSNYHYDAWQVLRAWTRGRLEVTHIERFTLSMSGHFDMCQCDECGRLNNYNNSNSLKVRPDWTFKTLVLESIA